MDPLSHCEVCDVMQLKEAAFCDRDMSWFYRVPAGT